MRNIFSMDGGFFAVMDKLANLFWLNILFVICSIPVFTIGASATALYYVTMKMVKDEDSYITKSFFKAFRQNFRQATIIWLMALGVTGVFLFDLRILSGYEALPYKVIMVIISAMYIVFIFCMIYVFPIISKFENSIKNSLKNALLMSIRHFPMTIAIIVITTIPFVGAYYIPYVLLFVLLFGASSIAYLTSKIYIKIFKNYIVDESKGTAGGLQ